MYGIVIVPLHYLRVRWKHTLVHRGHLLLHFLIGLTYSSVKHPKFNFYASSTFVCFYTVVSYQPLAISNLQADFQVLQLVLNDPKLLQEQSTRINKHNNNQRKSKWAVQNVALRLLFPLMDCTSSLWLSQTWREDEATTRTHFRGLTRTPV